MPRDIDPDLIEGALAEVPKLSKLLHKIYDDWEEAKEAKERAEIDEADTRAAKEQLTQVVAGALATCPNACLDSAEDLERVTQAVVRAVCEMMERQSGEDPSEWRAELAARVVRDRPQATPRDLAQVSGYMICAPGEHVPNWGKDSDHFWCRHCASWVPSEEGTDDRVERALGPTCDSCTDRLLTLRRVSQILERTP